MQRPHLERSLLLGQLVVLLLETVLNQLRGSKLFLVVSNHLLGALWTSCRRSRLQ